MAVAVRFEITFIAGIIITVISKESYTEYLMNIIFQINRGETPRT